MTTKTPPTMTIVDVPIEDLRPDPFNPRRIAEAALEALTKSIREFGLVQPILVRRQDNTVIGGHQRLRTGGATRQTWRGLGSRRQPSVGR